MATCLVIYIGNGFSENVEVYDKTYTYSVDMRDNLMNHNDKIFRHIRRRGYSIDFALLTNKHRLYDEFVREYNAIHIEYDEFREEDFKKVSDFYFWKTDIPPGWFSSGGRFLKVKSQIPKYDIYVIVRADLSFKMGLDELNVDYTKMNWLWPETDFRVFCPDLLDDYLVTTNGNDCWCWETYQRVNGNTLNIIPYKFFGAYSKYIWMEHTSLHFMLNDLYPLVTLEDVNMMLGYQKCWVTDVRFTENPVYNVNKTIISVNADVQTHRFGNE